MDTLDNDLSSTLVVSSDEEAIKNNLSLFWKLFSSSYLSIITLPNTNFWREELSKYQQTSDNHILIGNTHSLCSPSTSDDLIILGGTITDTKSRKYPKKRILAVVPVFNEHDIIAQTIQHLLDQDIDVYIIDNWSNDGSFELVQKLENTFPTRISLERFPTELAHEYDWTGILNRVSEIASENQATYDWIMLNDADEIRWSPWADINLREAISYIDSCGFNAIDYTVFNFEPVLDGFNENYDPVSFFTHGNFGTLLAYFSQVKTWKNNTHANLSVTAGHHVITNEQRIFPLKFLLCHYPLRSNQQARRKIFQERLPRFTEYEKNKGWHTHYDHYDADTTFIKDKEALVNYSSKDFIEKHLCQVLSGIGIRSDTYEL